MAEASPAFSRSVSFRPSFDFRRGGAANDYGIGSVRITFRLVGEKGAVQWMIGTDWFVESARKHLATFPRRDWDDGRAPKGWDLGYHSPTPHYEGQESRECDLLPGGHCYYDGSGLNADLLIEGFLAGGDDWVWSRLEAYYANTFEGAPWPDFTPIHQTHPDDRRAAQ